VSWKQTGIWTRGASRRGVAGLVLAGVLAAATARATDIPTERDPLPPTKALDRLAAVEPVSDAERGSIAEARRLADAKRFGDAARVLRAVLAREPKNTGARSLLARVLAWDRKYDESIAEYRTLLAEHPRSAFDRAGYARVLAWSGHAEASLREFRRAVRADSTDLESRIGYARALSWTGDLPGASIEFRRILRANPRYGDAWLGLATVARWRGAPTASDRFLARAEALHADEDAAREERKAVREALAPSLGAGWTTSHERQYVDFAPDFTIESTGPFAQARATVGKTAGIGVRAARLEQFERNVTTLNYDLDMTVLRADVSMLRAYPFQIAAGVEARKLEAGATNVIYPLLGDDEFTGWNARAWWFLGRWTPSVAARREYLPIKSTAGPQRILAGDQTLLAADLAYQWNARGTLSAGIENGSYSDDNERGTVRAGAAYRVRLKAPSATLDYAIAATDFDTTSASYFTPLESVRHTAGIGVAGYSERASLDWGARYQLSAVLSSNFDDIFTNTWSGYLNLTAFDTLPLGIEGSYSRDNNAYETWFLGLSAAARW
jgi:Tfp pilus assembly protein PilF